MRYAMLLLILLQIMKLSGQENTSRQKHDSSAYIAPTDTLVTVRLNFNNEFEYFRQQGTDFMYDLRPNISVSSKLAFSYRFISFGIGFTPKFIPGNNDDAQQGKTDAFAFGFVINSSHLVQELQYGKVKGFYLHNSGDFIAGWDQAKDPYIQVPNLAVVQASGSTAYKFNRNFSLKAISSQSEIQLKSCGSFIPSISYSFYQVDNGAPSGSPQTSQKSNNFQSVVNAGYFYTLVLNSSFYIAAGINPGIGLNYTTLITRLPTGNEYDSYGDMVLRTQEKAGIGYNSGKFFAGAEFSIAHSLRNVNISSVQLEVTRIYYQFFLGYRFTAPSLIRRETNAVKKAVPDRFQKLLE